ncbi:dihydrofolate reductase [Deefgea tanakiae]|jgi:dihydrofolate reductase|uniref:Dihydrofolate reductase n=1 Tax=Deefgea tanakiae TaxID=2865840 RepID=A0ABX8Z6U9_9NEIS|nr:dihydrofolate reductase [Deefgea tanakiae]QZA76639.1 dihydrofolate reductase [Deefgea tanakiae]
MQVAIISALGQNRVIGINNQLPWRLPEDLKHFKALTMACPMIMGRKTFESLPGLLPGRPHWVITRNADFQAAGAICFTSIEAAIAAAKSADYATVFIIGGGEIYQQSLALADELYLTEVALSPVGDAYFPEFDREKWQEVSREPNVSANGIEYAFVKYSKA